MDALNKSGPLRFPSRLTRPQKPFSWSLSFLKALPKWLLTAWAVSAMVWLTQDQLAINLVGLFWVSIPFAIMVRELRKHFNFAFKHAARAIILYHSILLAFIAQPVLATGTPPGGATGGACNAVGLFAPLINFVAGVFSYVAFGGVAGGTLSQLICGVVGYVTILLTISFLFAAGFVGYRINQGQPFTEAIQPLMGFVVFAGTASVILVVMIGNGTAPTP